MDYSSYTDHQIQDEMIKYGLKMCPITKTTRNFLINKLKKARDGKKDENPIENDTSSPINDPISNGTLEVENDQKCVDDSFYGICKSGNESTPTVVRSLVQAVSLAKSSPGSRFRAFKSYEDAEFFSKSHQTSSFYDSFSLMPKESDPTSKYPSIHPSSKNKFKLSIINNDLAEIKKLIESNPKYLITPCDIPTTIHEGFHRNALHVAVFNNRPEVTQLILFTIKNIFWVSKFYSFDNPCDGEAFEKSERLLDCILNTPDKAAFDTPLHIACKYGYVEIVKMLLNEPLTDRNFKNSYNEIPFDIICTRYTDDDTSQVELEIKALFDNNCFVVLSQGNSAINAECITTNLKSIQHLLAIIGPTTSIIADKIVNSINKSKHDIELNKYYRSLAKKYECISYLEYFKFIGTIIDISSLSGLSLLEYYLMDRTLSPENNDTFTSRRLFFNDDSTIEENLFDSFSNLSINCTSFHTNNSLNLSSRKQLQIHQGVFLSKWNDSLLQEYLISILRETSFTETDFPNIHALINKHS